MTIYFGPNPGTYGVIRMDPVAMVQHLNDPEALAEAEAMQPKSYLVYLEHVRHISSFFCDASRLQLLNLCMCPSDTCPPVPRSTVVSVHGLGRRPRPASSERRAVHHSRHVHAHIPQRRPPDRPRAAPHGAAVSVL